MQSKPDPARQRRRTLTGIGIAAVLAVFPTVSRAQASAVATDTVTRIAAEFFNAVVAARWGEASRLLDTMSLSAMRRRSADYARQWRATPPATLKQFMDANPDLPRAVAANKVKEANERTRELGKALSVYGVEDPDSLLALPMETYASRWLEIHDERWQLRESARRCGHGAPRDIPVPPYRVIAGIPGDTIAYVLYDPGAERSPRASTQEARTPRVMILRRRGSGWSIIPRDDLIGWGEMVNACG